MRLNPFLNGKYEVEQIIENVIKKGQFLEIINGCVYQNYGINNGVKSYKFLSEYSFEIPDWCDHVSIFTYDIKVDKIVEKGVNNTKYIWKKIDKYKYIQKSYL